MRRGIAARHAPAFDDSTTGYSPASAADESPDGTTGECSNSEDDDSIGYVVHLPVRTRSRMVAMRLARALARSLAFLPEFEPTGTTVSRGDEQGVHHRVFCDRRVAGGQRCPKAPGHRGPCLVVAADPARPPG